MKNDLLRIFANWHRINGNEYMHISEIYKELKRIKSTYSSNSIDNLRRKLEKLSNDQIDKLFVVNEFDSDFYKSVFEDSFDRITKLKIGDVFTRDSLLKIFKHSGMRGIDFSSRTYSLILVSNEVNEYYDDSTIENGRLIYTGEGLTGDQVLAGNNLTLAESQKNELPVYLFTKDKNRMYRFEGQVVVEANPYMTEENGRMVYKFPLKIVDYVETDSYAHDDDFIKVVNSVEEIRDNIEFTSVSNEGLKFIDEPIKIRKYKPAKERKTVVRTSKPDYIAEEILKSKQGEITEKDVLEFEINRVMQLEVDGLVEAMENFFENKKDNEGYDILSFEIDNDGNVIKKYIEVKSTKGDESTPIEISDGELKFAEANKNNYYIYRVFNSASEVKCLKIINGNELFEKFQKVPTHYKLYGV